jgi:predicted nucleotidyltransferase
MADCAMDKETIKAALRAHERELKSAGIVHLHLHGSVVRGEAGRRSDVDLAAQFDRAKLRGILAEISLKNRLSEILGVEADLADADTLKEMVQANFEREAELVF